MVLFGMDASVMVYDQVLSLSTPGAVRVLCKLLSFEPLGLDPYACVSHVIRRKLAFSSLTTLSLTLKASSVGALGTIMSACHSNIITGNVVVSQPSTFWS